MLPVYQTIVDAGRGNCLQAAMASLFHLELEQVPHFILYGDAWFKVLWNWLRALDHEYQFTGGLEDIPTAPLINGAIFCTVKSKLFFGSTHAVLIDRSGIVVHDPNPQKLYLGENVIESEAFVCIGVLRPIAKMEAA